MSGCTPLRGANHEFWCRGQCSGTNGICRGRLTAPRSPIALPAAFRPLSPANNRLAVSERRGAGDNPAIVVLGKQHETRCPLASALQCGRSSSFAAVAAVLAFGTLVAAQLCRRRMAPRCNSVITPSSSTTFSLPERWSSALPGRRSRWPSSSPYWRHCSRWPPPPSPRNRRHAHRAAAHPVRPHHLVRGA